MPGFDGTGPAGAGPMTGGGRGWCTPYGGPDATYGPRYAAQARPPYGATAPAYGFGRPRWGLRRGFPAGRGFLGGRGGRGRGGRGGRGRW